MARYSLRLPLPRAASSMTSRWVLAPWEAVPTPWWTSPDPQAVPLHQCPKTDLELLGLQSWGLLSQ